jgi:hypothetical protein
VVRLDEASVLGVLPPEVDEPQIVQHRLDDPAHDRPALIDDKVRERAGVLAPAVVGQVLKPRNCPATALFRALAVVEQQPLHLRSDQRTQAEQRHLAVHPRDGARFVAPAPELHLVGVGNRDRLTPGGKPSAPLGGQLSSARQALALVAEQVPAAEPQRGHRELGADHHLTPAEPGNRVLRQEPGIEVGVLTALVRAEAVPSPAGFVQVAQFGSAHGRNSWADEAVRWVVPGQGLQRSGDAAKGDDARAFRPHLPPLRVVRGAVVDLRSATAFAVRDPADPAVGRVVSRQADDLGPEQRIDGRRGHERGQDLQPVADGPAHDRPSDDGQQHERGCRCGHSDSPQTASRAAMNSGECWSGCP